MDKHTRGVRHLERGRENGGRAPNDAGTDRRVRRTQGLLREALASLVHEKPYDAIVVKEILARANVGRSTFYTHFRDKDELLVSGIHEMLRSSAPAAAGTTSWGERILRFGLPIFEHIERHRDARDSTVDARGHVVVHEHLERVLAELVAADLRRAGPDRQQRGPRMPPDLLARHVAATFILVLNWWAASENPLPAEEVNDLFRALTLPTLTPVLG
jgi:AcrR family transcriptional regulator